MTRRSEPPGRFPRPDSYRPPEERTGPPTQRPHQHPPHQPPGIQGQHPAPGRAYASQQGRPVSERRPRPPSRPGPQGGRPAPRKRSAAGSFVVYGVLGLVAMVAGAVAVTLTALPANVVRDHVIAAVKERTGRDLVIAGPASFTLYPAVGISLSDVSLSGASGLAGSRPLASMAALDVSVALWPLLGREVRVTSLRLRDPVFNLDVAADGRKSWDLAAAGGRSAWIRVAQNDGTLNDAPVSDAEPAGSAASRGGGLRLSELKLEDVRIDNGTLNYSDARTGSESTFSAIHAELVLAALSEPLLAKGSLAWKGKTMSFDGTMTSVADVMESRPAKLKLAVGVDVLDAAFEGSADLKHDLAVEGILSARSSSARALAGWLGTELPPSAGFGALDAKGLFRGRPDQYTFATAEIVVDQTTARGEVSLDTRGARPYVKADLKLTELDLNTYAAHGSAEGGAPRPQRQDGDKGGAQPGTQSGAQPDAQSIDDLLKRAEEAPGPRVKGYTKRDGWDEDTFDLDILGRLDADAKLSIGRLAVRTFHLDQSDLTVALKNRVMTTTLNRVSLYEGTGTGTVVLDGTAGNAVNFASDIALEGISAQPLLKDAAELDRLTGKGRLTLTLVGKGKSEREIVETLDGRVAFAFADGAIVGANIPEMMRKLSKGNFGGLDTKPSDTTDFSELTSTWTVKSGIAENQDLKLVSPLLRLTGSGRVALPAREVDYMLRPKVVASLAGQGGAQDLSGIEVPVRVHGPWQDPKFTPDLTGALKNPKTVDAIKEIGKQFKGKKADEIMNDLLGGGSDGESGKAKGKKLLEQFLNPE